MSTVTITTTPERAEAMRRALAEQESGVAPWARLNEDDARSAPSILKLLQGARADVETAQRAHRPDATAAA